MDAMAVTYLPHLGPASTTGLQEGTTNHTKLHERSDVGQRLAGQVGAAFSNPSASELAWNCENTSLIHSADVPASSPLTRHLLLA